MGLNSRISRYKNIPMVALIVGVGSGSKLYQSLLDGHKNILVIPGYPLMYFYPFWRNYVQSGMDWEEVLALMICKFPSVFDSRLMPGSEALDRLGTNGSDYLKIDVLKFQTAFLSYVEGEALSSWACLLAFHFAYVEANDDLVDEIKVLVYHIHVNRYLRDLFFDFPGVKVIASVRDVRGNISRRVSNSVDKANEVKFRKSDYMVMRIRAYRQMISLVSDGLDFMRFIPRERVRIFRHEDMVLRLKSLMRESASFIGVEFLTSMLRPTFGGKSWNASFYDFDKSCIANPDIIKEAWRDEEAKRDLFVYEGVYSDLLTSYGYVKTVVYGGRLLDKWIMIIFMMLPSRLEWKAFTTLFSIKGFHEYFNALWLETKSLLSLRSYKDNMFYSLKWTNDGIDFSRTMFYEHFLDWSASCNNDSMLSRFLLAMAEFFYFLSGLMKYCGALFRMPFEVALRVRAEVGVICRRIANKRYFPDPL